LPVKTKAIALVALMAALANILSVGITITLGTFTTAIHFSQLPIFMAGILGGPIAGLMTGAIGGVVSSFVILPKIPFIIGGLAILGGAAGFFTKRFRPLFAGILAWLVQAPYVAVTDYVWFTLFMQRTPQTAWAVIASILILLTIEAVISGVLAEVITAYMKKARITL